MDRSNYSGVPVLGIILLFALALTRSVAQDASAGADDLSDFESSLFSDSVAVGTGGAEGAPPAGAASPPAAVPTDAARIETLVGGTVAIDATAATAPADSGYLASSGLESKLFAKVTVPDYGALYAAYNVSHAFFQAYGGDGSAPPADDPYEPSFDLAELHYSFDMAKRLFVRLGNQLVSWGPSRIWTPVDFINAEKVDSFADVDLRVGKPGLRLHLLLPRGNAFLFADFSPLAKDGAYGNAAEEVNLAGRADTTLGGFEFGLSSYGGMNEQARFGADFSGRLLGSTVYGELAYGGAYASYDAFFQAALGFSRVLGDLRRWTVSAEGFFNSRGHDLGGYSRAELAGLPPEETVPLYQGSYYAYAALDADKLFSEYLSTTLSLLANLEDRSYSIKISESAAFPRAVPFVVSLAYAGGGAEKEFTRFGGNGSLAMTLSTKIEF